jgi:ABC-type Mn2+/Zn2+ transport system permease subunit
MITEFLDSWILFGNTYLAGWLIAALLGLIGVVAVARNQIFIGAAVAQASTFGFAVALMVMAHFGAEFADPNDSEQIVTAISVAFSVAAAFLTERSIKPGGESREAILGWMFLAGSAGATLVVAKSPHGLEEVQRVVASSLIGASERDVGVLAAIFVIVATVIARYRSSIVMFALDPETARAHGIRVGLWRFLICITFGVCVGVAIRISGLVYTFGCLVLPALIAKNICREIRTMFLAAPIIAVLTATSAFVYANHADFPPAQLEIVLLALLLVAAWVFGRLRPSAR